MTPFHLVLIIGLGVAAVDKIITNIKGKSEKPAQSQPQVVAEVQPTEIKKQVINADLENQDGADLDESLPTGDNLQDLSEPE